ncbi:MAG: CoB--CoM heterodisulfide reductase iron-sulfur subunit B family protein [Candidatus Desulfofervidaceae bacterium]|nr:CoB--CoM heterodisulfide reductase iron-sulfur subunit B family protein [Candidatus Desulfofervidaceae bacterium]MDL1969502.1 CoB--CoM heterodisulfide reductase iron-sulfur subunit B family protein [Candidatus Desulfofervidaceae bacterium]
MEIAYFPGCTLKTTARALETSALAVAKTLGIAIKELPSWTCCGTCYSLAEDDLIKQVAPIRTLARTANLGYSILTTLCSVCYNTLAQANLFVKAVPTRLEKINAFMEEEANYAGNVEVKHFLTLLQELGAEKVSEAVKRPLSGLKVACYYGCLLLRPQNVAIDDPEQPSILENIMKSIGAEPVFFPYQVECCGSYHTAVKPEIVARRAHLILENAIENGADIVVTSCPLCSFNLKERQKDIKRLYPGFKGLPVFYFTEVMAEAFGITKILKGI